MPDGSLVLLGRLFDVSACWTDLSLVLLGQNGQQNKCWVTMGKNSKRYSDGSAKPATGGVRDDNPCSSGNAKLAAAAVRDPHQNFLTPSPSSGRFGIATTGV
jgi:hypothetical protein